MKIYFLKSQLDGKFFRSRGQNGYGPRWVAKLEDAKSYTKIGQAKGQISRWHTLYPNIAPPLLVEAEVSIIKEHDITNEVIKKRNKKLERFVREANRARQDWLHAPEPANYRDQARIDVKKRFQWDFERAMYHIKQFEEVNINEIGLDATSL